jgi:hypothetical protein
MENNKKLIPGRWMYLLGVLIIAAGIVISAILITNLAGSAFKNGKTAQIPGQTELSLNKASTYTITYYYDPTGNKNAPITNYSKYDGLSFKLSEEQGGKNIPITSLSSGVMQFKTDASGKYMLNVSSPKGSGASAVMLIVPKSGITGAIIAAVFFSCAAAGFAVIIAAAILRKKHRAV